MGGGRAGAGRGGLEGVKIIPAWKKCLFVMAASEITQPYDTSAVIFFLFSLNFFLSSG